MRILMVIPQLGYGGAEGSFLRIAHYLAGRAEVTIALMARDYGTSAYSTAGASTHLPVILLDEEGHARPSSVAKAARWWRMIRRLRSLKGAHDVTISFLSGANLLNALAGQPHKTIVSERGSKRFDTEISRGTRALWTRLLDPLIYARSARIVCASAGLAHEVASANPRAAGKVCAIEGTVEAHSLIEAADAAIDQSFAALSEFPTLASFGRLHHSKGYDFLLRSFAQVQRDLPSARLLLLGDGPELGRLMQLAGELGLTAGTTPAPRRFQVIFAGYQKSPVRYLRLARLGVFPSRYEGLPNALIEALAGGVPLLASDCRWGPRSILAGADAPGPKELVTLPKRVLYGTLMPPPDEPGAQDTWAREITLALSIRSERRGPASCRGAIARFDISATGARWMHLVSDLARGPAAAQS